MYDKGGFQSHGLYTEMPSFEYSISKSYSHRSVYRASESRVPAHVVHFLSNSTNALQLLGYTVVMFVLLEACDIT